MRLNIQNFTTKFDALIDDLARAQLECVPAYDRLIWYLEQMRQLAVNGTVTMNQKIWMSIMNNTVLKPDEKAILFTKLDETIPDTTIAINEHIKNRQNTARTLFDRLDISALISQMTSLLQDSIVKQTAAASQLVDMATNLPNEVLSIFARAEKIKIEIEAKLKATKQFNK